MNPLNAARKPRPTKKAVAAAKAVLQKITYWSYSAWKDYRACPFAAYHKMVLKEKDPSPITAPLQNGIDRHKESQDYLKGYLTKLPEGLVKLKKEYTALKKVVTKQTVEQEWAFDKDWQATDWYGNKLRPAWLRVKMDAYHFNTVKKVLTIVDLKTGKMRDEEYQDQFDLYTLAGLLRYPDAKKVVSQLLYADYGKVIENVYDVKPTSLEEMKKLWLQRTLPMFSDTRFDPTPNKGCTWCFLSREKDGPCKVA